MNAKGITRRSSSGNGTVDYINYRDEPGLCEVTLTPNFQPNVEYS